MALEIRDQFEITTQAGKTLTAEVVSTLEDPENNAQYLVAYIKNQDRWIICNSEGHPVEDLEKQEEILQLFLVLSEQITAA